VKKEDILKEELTRMRQLMGMNGSLYQKPIMDERGSSESPPPAGRGEESSPPPSPPPPPPAPAPRPAPGPQKGAKSTDDSRPPRTKPSKALSGDFILPISSIPRFGNKGKKSGKKKKN